MSVLAALLVVGGSAAARAAADDTYSARACQGGADHLFLAGHAAAGMRAVDRCPFGQSGNTGITIETIVRPGRAPNGAYADQLFTAPAGTGIARVSLSLYGDGRAFGWRARVETSDGDRLADCPTHCHAASVQSAASSVHGGVSSARDSAASVRHPVRWVRLRLICVSGSGCPYASGGRPAGRLALAGATIRITDHASPTFAGLGGPLASPAWHHGTLALNIKASDGSGVREIDLLVPSGTPGRQPVSVATWRPRRLGTSSESTTWPSLYAPISSAGISVPVNTASLPNGRPTRLSLRLIDGVGNQTIKPVAFYIDNAPPPPPVLGVAERQAWQRVAMAHVGWATPGDLSGVRSAQRLMCWAALPTACLPVMAAPLASAWLPYPIPTLGDWLMRVRMTDYAGNTGAWSAPVHVRYDNVVPGKATPESKGGWFNANDVANGSERILQATPFPVSGVAGYAVTVAYDDGTSAVPASPAVPGDVINSNREYFPLRSLSRTGVWQMASRAVSVSGVASGTFGVQTGLRVDVDAPTVRADASADLAAWQSRLVVLSLAASDPPRGSGMGVAPAGRPVTEGAYVAYSVDGGAGQAIAGDQATTTITAEGAHTVRFHADDLAGNPSPEQTVSVRIDRTPPDAVTILPPDPGDPRRVAVTAHDALSGIAGGEVQVRRQGTSQWVSAPAAVSAGRLVAHVSDDGLPDGTYDVRALARDAAGNTTVGSQRSDGAPVTLTFPLRVPTQLIAGRAISGCRRHTARGGSCPARIGRGGTIRVAYGHGATLAGVLQTTAQRPLAGRAVNVARRLGTSGAFVDEATVRTDRRGRFRFRAPKGTSRSVRFTFPGSALLRAAGAEVHVAVPAHSSIRVNHGRVRAGHAVRLGGRLAGPLPAGPLVVIPEAYFRAGWHSIGKPTTTDSKGRWSMPYSFLPSTRGSFAFRVEVPHQAGYPYDRGHSRTASVRVV